MLFRPKASSKGTSTRQLALVFCCRLATMPPESSERVRRSQQEKFMRVRVLDLDSSITAQDRFLCKFQPDVHDLLRWGPSLRLACRWQRFHRFERWLDRSLERSQDRHECRDPWI